MSKRIIIPVVGWLLGNLTWSIIWYIIARLRPDEPVIWAVGMAGLLVLVVAGVLGTGWYFLRDRPGSSRVLEFENMARVVTAVYISQKYDVTADELADAGTPGEMEERAKRIQAERELARLRGASPGC